MVNASPTICVWRDMFFFSYSPFVVILLELSFRAAMSICVLVLLGRVLFAVFATNNPPSFTNIYIYWTVQLYIIQNDLLYNCNCVLRTCVRARLACTSGSKICYVYNKPVENWIEDHGDFWRQTWTRELDRRSTTKAFYSTVSRSNEDSGGFLTYIRSPVVQMNVELLK
jgi:hypothetical protein